MSKTRYPTAAAIAAARPIVNALRPASDRIIVAGSLRRRKQEVGDIEILYIPKIEQDQPVPGDLFARKTLNLADEAIAVMEKSGLLARRKTVNGTETFGPKNKLMLHVESGIPVDLFSATAENWWNYLVCRTGPAESNTRIATLAQQRGWKWNPYGPGFTRGGALAGPHDEYEVTSEEAVFQFVGLPYNEPWER